LGEAFEEYGMATRFDSVTTTTRIRHPEIDLDLSEAALARVSELALLAASAPPDEARHLPPAELASALVTWLTVVFGLCYVIGPIALSLLGMLPPMFVFDNLWYSLPTFGMAGFVAVATTLAVRPRIRLRGPRDPVIAATAGGLGVWALVENFAGPFVPFGMMTTAHLAGLVALNVLEMFLLGSMLASFTRSTSVAFVLGAGFQLLWAGVAMAILALAF
jgi:hypothetical protein